MAPLSGATGLSAAATSASLRRGSPARVAGSGLGGTRAGRLPTRSVWQARPCRREACVAVRDFFEGRTRGIGVGFADLIVDGVGGERLAWRRQIAFSRLVVELQAVADARVDEDLDGGERNDKALRDAVERQLHLEAVFRDDQVPEAVLQDDRHLARIFFFETFREDDARSLGQKRNVEMMLAGQTRSSQCAAARRARPRASPPAAALRNLWSAPLPYVSLQESHVLYRPLRSVLPFSQDRAVTNEKSGGLLLPGALRTAPYPARGKGFEFRLFAPHYAARATSA